MTHLLVVCQCGKELRLKPEHAGRSGQCKQCGAKITVPAADVLERYAGREVSLGDLATLDSQQSTDTAGRPEEAAPSATTETAGGLWQPGQLVDGRYEVQSLLGQGAYGSVWKVRHTGWNLDLAVKELRTDKGLSKQRRDNFVREAQTWVDDIGMHPHIVTAW